MGPNKSAHVEAAAYSMLVLATIAVCLRFWSRKIAKKAGFWWDDWTALSALPFVWAMSGLSIYWVHIGLGKHMDQTLKPPTDQAKVLFAVNLIYNTGLSIVKMSVLLFYFRVFKVVKIYKIAFWLTGFLIVGWFIAINFLAIFTCVPVRKKWQPKLKGHCLSEHTTFIGATAPNIIIDGIILLLPVAMVWRLQISLQQKTALIVVFLAGYCVIIMSILRMVTVLQEGNTLDEDLTWNITEAQILLICETPVALISACLPSILNLARHGFERFVPDFSRGFWSSHPLSGSGGETMGRVANRIDGKINKEFSVLESDTDESPATGLYSGPRKPATHAVAYPSHQESHQGATDPKTGLELTQIHIRNDVYVDV